MTSWWPWARLAASVLCLAAIIAQHDGAVKLEETDGGGATFTVRIPHTKPVDEVTEDA